MLAKIYETPHSPSRIIPMEGVRGFAVLLVFFVHFNALFGKWMVEGGLTAGLWSILGNIGHSGVDLFFVLSGYLIYGAVISRKTPYGHFMARRFQRIYPPFLAVFAIYLPLWVLFPAENKIPAGAATAAVYLGENILLLPGLFNIPPLITVAWSLSYEFFYYLTIPLFVSWLSLREWLPRSRMALFAALAFAYTIFCTLDIQPRLQLITFVAGILLFEVLKRPRVTGASSFRRDLVGVVALALVFPIAYLVMAKSPWLDIVPGLSRRAWFLKIGVQFMAFPVFLDTCFRSNSFLGKVFSGRFIRYLGNMSYSYYLIHGLTLKFTALVVARALARFAAPGVRSDLIIWLALVPAFAATWAASTALYAFVEKPFSLPAVRGKPTSTR